MRLSQPVTRLALLSRGFSMAGAAQAPRIRRISPLAEDEAKWTTLQKIEWTDQDGKDRVWEAAARKTRKESGIDAVAIAPILRHPSRPPSTLVILQYRPPVDAICVEFPAGLIDAGETPEQAAVRELREETGYEGQVLDCSPTIVADPGLTNANMQMVTIEVNLKEGDAEPEQHLEDGEHIERVVVPLDQLYERLQEFSKEKGKIVDARLFHWALEYGRMGYIPDIYVAGMAWGWHWGRIFAPVEETA